MRTVPESANRADWPRLVAQAVNNAGLAIAALEAATDWSALVDYADDTAAAAGGVAIGSLYRTGSTLKVRVT